MTTSTFTAVATDSVTGQTGTLNAAFTVAAGGGAVMPFAVPGANWIVNGQGLKTIPVVPGAVGDLLVLAIGAGGAGAVNELCLGVSGGGVTTWTRKAGYVATAENQLVEIWEGVVATAGSATIAVSNPSMSNEWNRYWCQEYSANAASLAWTIAAASPAPVAAADTAGSGMTIVYPPLTGTGLYIGAAEDSYGAIANGSTAGFAYTVIDGHLQVVTNAAATNGAPTASSANSGEIWNAAAMLVTCTGVAIPLSIPATTLSAARTTQAYSAALAAVGGNPPYTWSLASGTLPAGLSLSAAGVISGTPATAGTSSFTVKVTDSSAATATAALSVVVSASPPVVATLNFPGSNEIYTAPAADPKLSLAGNTALPYFNNDIWGPVSGETCDATVYSVRNWSLVCNANNPGGGVTCFPNTGSGWNVPSDWYNYTYLVSGWDETMDTASDIIASACYDNWFTSNTLVGPQGAIVTEVMFHYDFRNRGAGPWVATAVPFGGYSVNVPGVGEIAVPLTYWNLAVPNGSTAAYWNMVNTSGSITSLPKGAVDAKAMFEWLVTNGYLANPTPLTAFSIGYEICSTGGNNNNFTYNDFYWYGA
jgi:Putative Ig domain